MSRCFPYPPPGYTRKGTRVEAALIESIKLQSDRQKSKTDRKKEKSKDKKQKTKGHKGKSSDGHDGKVKKLDDLKGPNEKKCKDGKNLQKGAKNEAEQVEKSGLTEEHGQPICPQSPGYLSDGTQSSHKRKRDASQHNEGCKPGKIIRIKLASLNHQESNSSLRREQTCSTSGRDTLLDQQRGENTHEPIQEKSRFTNSQPAVGKDATLKPKIEGSLSVHGGKEISSRCNDILIPCVRNSPKTAYEALFEKWMPPAVQLEQFASDEEWLFGTRQSDGQAPKINKAVDHVPSCRSSSLWPRGQYLPEADIYSLPYTIPF